MNLYSWLNRPFPFITEFKSQLLVALAFGFIIYLFLIIFQPFGIEQVIGNKAIYLLGFGVISFVVLMVSFNLFAVFTNTLLWNIKKEFFFVLINIIVITVLNYYYNTIVGINVSQQHSLWEFTLFTIAVGFFPVLLFVFLTEKVLTKKHQKEASIINSRIQKENTDYKAANETIIKIIPKSKNEILEIAEKNLIFIKSEDNYCKVYFHDVDSINHRLIRISLKTIEDQLAGFPDIIRTHRSYIVNKKQIKKITGNARAYYLYFNGCNETASVSRNFPKEKLI